MGCCGMRLIIFSLTLVSKFKNSWKRSFHCLMIVEFRQGGGRALKECCSILRPKRDGSLCAWPIDSFGCGKETKDVVALDKLFSSLLLHLPTPFFHSSFSLCLGFHVAIKIFFFFWSCCHSAKHSAIAPSSYRKRFFFFLLRRAMKMIIFLSFSLNNSWGFFVEKPRDSFSVSQMAFLRFFQWVMVLNSSGKLESFSPCHWGRDIITFSRFFQAFDVELLPGLLFLFTFVLGCCK